MQLTENETFLKNWEHHIVHFICCFLFYVKHIIFYILVNDFIVIAVKSVCV